MLWEEDAAIRFLCAETPARESEREKFLPLFVFDQGYESKPVEVKANCWLIWLTVAYWLTQGVAA